MAPKKKPSFRGGFGRGRGGIGQARQFPPPPGGNGFGRQNDWPAPQLSMAEAGRQTERHGWSNGDLKLRHSVVKFISAGTMTSQNEAVAENSKATEDAEEDREAQAMQLPGAVVTSEPVAAEQAPMPAEHLAQELSSKMSSIAVTEDRRSKSINVSRAPSTVSKNGTSFLIDSPGKTAHEATGLTSSATRASSISEMSDSSEDVVVFKGRKARLANATTRDSTAGVSKVGSRFDPEPKEDAGPAISHRRSRRRKGTRTVPWTDAFHQAEMEEIDAEIAADYIAHARDDEDELSDASKDSKDVDQNLEDQDTATRTEHVPDEDAAVSDELDGQSPKLLSWNADDIRDFDDLSTSSEASGLIESILAERTRLSGLQALVVTQGKSVDYAKWVLATSLRNESDASKLAQFRSDVEEEKAQQRDEPQESSASESDGPESALHRLLAKEVKAKTRADALTSHRYRMTDEEIAARLAKQEELGYGSSELLLFGADEAGQFEDESEEEDLYAGFDIMDRERPSLQRASTRRRGKSPLEASDSDLAAIMQAAWANDRVQKKVRKQQREELRAQGLLAGGDRQAGYPDGMTMLQIKREMQVFIDSTAERLNFPPMPKEDRKRIHHIASAFELKSKSFGSKANRSTFLVRTKRTKRFNDQLFDSVSSFATSAKSFRRPAARRDPRSAGGPRSGGFGAGVYRDGEVVGAAAPEIGLENRGRTMLEKMGWSTGSGLGAVNNKGIVEPISQIIKRSKAGLA